MVAQFISDKCVGARHDHEKARHGGAPKLVCLFQGLLVSKEHLRNGDKHQSGKCESDE
jgi:hypothetical protein